MPRARRRVATSQAAVAAHCGVKPRIVANWLKQPGFPAKRRGYFDLDAIDRWREATAPPPAGDPLLSGPDSPALERYREARAKLTELEYRKQISEVIDRAAVHEWLTRVAARLRQAGETLQRKFGAEAQEILDDAIDDIGRAGGVGDGNEFGMGAGAGVLRPVGEGGPAAPDGPVRG